MMIRWRLGQVAMVGCVMRLRLSAMMGQIWRCSSISRMLTEINYLGDVPKGALIWGAQLVHGSEALDYRATSGTQVQNECTKYVKYNTVEKAWDSGVLWRSAWIDTSVWGHAVAGRIRTIRIQQHERGYDDDDQPMRGCLCGDRLHGAG